LFRLFVLSFGSNKVQATNNTHKSRKKKRKRTQVAHKSLLVIVSTTGEFVLQGFVSLFEIFWLVGACAYAIASDT
jgi:hypothetical protein